MASKLKVALPDRPSGSLIYSSASQTAPHWFTPFFLFFSIILLSFSFIPLPPPPLRVHSCELPHSGKCVYCLCSTWHSSRPGYTLLARYICIQAPGCYQRSLSLFVSLRVTVVMLTFGAVAVYFAFLYLFFFASSFSLSHRLHSIISKPYISLQAMQGFVGLQRLSKATIAPPCARPG